jgi:hypothetical protein
METAPVKLRVTVHDDDQVVIEVADGVHPHAAPSMLHRIARTIYTSQVEEAVEQGGVIPKSDRDEAFAGPEWEAFATRFREDAAPMIEDSALTLSLVPEDTDVKFSVELGYSIMLNKPIVLLVVPGQRVPEKLVLLADDVVLWDPLAEGYQEQVAARIQDLSDRFEEYGWEGNWVTVGDDGSTQRQERYETRADEG